MALAPLALLLLAAPAAPAQTADDLPVVGTPEALEHQEAFRAWSAEHGKQPVAPFTLDFTVAGDIHMTDEGEGMDIRASFQVAGTTLYITPRIFQHDLEVTVDVEDMQSFQFPVSIRFDGKMIHFTLGAIPGTEMEDGIRVKVNQAAVEEIYVLYLKMMPRFVEILSSELEGQLVPDMSGFLETVFALMPPDLPSYVHPATMFHYGSKSMTCRRFQENGGVVDAYLALDLQEGSVMRTAFDELSAFFEELELGDEDMEEIHSVLTVMAEVGQMHCTFDAITGIPLSMAMDFDLDPSLIEPGAEGNFSLDFTYTGNLLKLTDPDSLSLPALDESIPPLDLSGFVQMGISQLRSMMDELDSGEDMEF